MNKFKHYLKVFSIAFCVLALVGCGSSSSSSSSDSSSDDGAVSVSGSTEVSGTVTVSNAAITQASAGSVSSRVTLLSGMALQERVAQTKQRITLYDGSISSVEDEVALDGGRVYVSIVNADGTVTTTNHFAEINSEGEYGFNAANGNALADGKTYVFRAVNFYEDGDGNINEVVSERIERIDEGETAVESPIQPGMNVIMKTVIDRLATSGVDESTLEIVIGVITDAISELIENGDIVVEAQVTTVATAEEASSRGLTATNFFDESEDVNAVDTTLSNTDKEAKSRAEAKDDVANVFKEAELKEKRNKDVSEMSENEVRGLVRDMFGVAEGSNSAGKGSSDSGGGVPEFYIAQFADAYTNGASVSIDGFSAAWLAGLPTEERTQEELNTEFTASMNSIVAAIYSAYDSQTVTKSAAKIMADQFFDGDFDAAVKVALAFPNSPRLTLPLTSASEMDVLQSILMFGITGLFDDTEGGDDTEGDDSEFNPIAFTTGLGFVSLEDETVYITESRIRPVSIWVPADFSDHSSTWSETDALDIEVSLLANGVAESDIAKVVLIYTDLSDEQQTVELTLDDYDYSGGDAGDVASKVALLAKHSAAGASAHNRIVVQEGEASTASEVRYRLNPWNFYESSDGSSIVGDYKAGEATVQVWGDTEGENVLASRAVEIYKFDVDVPTWVFPQGPDMDIVRKQGWDPTFEPQYIPLEEGEETVSPRLEWSAVGSDLPDGFRVAYSVHVGLQVFRLNHDDPIGDTTALVSDDSDWEWSDEYGKWDHIWDTWQSNRLVFDNFVILPETVQLRETTSDTDNNYQATYEVSIRPLVVDETGTIVWEGNESRTNFKVGTPPSYTYDLQGTITFPDNFATNSHVAETAGTWKIGLFYNQKKNESGRLKDVFWDQDNGDARSPIEVDSTPLVYDLGTFSDITSNPDRTYTLPSFSSTDGLLQRHESMMFIVWYDVSEAPEGDSRWSSITPETDKIDVFDDVLYGAHPIEDFEWVNNGHLRYEDGSLVLDYWDEATHQGERKFLEVTENRTIDRDVYEWMDSGSSED